MDVTKIEERISNIEKFNSDLAKIGGVQVGAVLGGVQIATPADFELISRRLALGGPAVPPHIRDAAGTCFALCMQALEWGMPIMSVINKSYVVKNRGVDRIAYESQLIHAVIEKNAPLKGRLRYEITGEGDERRCKVWATFKRETKPHEYVSETLKKLRDARGKNEEGVVKGSPLWESNPEVQLFYSASRQWARLYCPDVLLGAYTPDEYEDAPALVDVTPKISELSQRLKDAKLVHADLRGFDQAHVTTIVEGETKGIADENVQGSVGSTDSTIQRDDVGSGGNDNQNATGSPVADTSDHRTGRVTTGKDADKKTRAKK